VLAVLVQRPGFLIGAAMSLRRSRRFTFCTAHDNPSGGIMSGLLTGKNAVIYGAGGALGSGVARTFAAEGARVHLAGRTRAPLEALAAELGAEHAVFDATDERAVTEHLDSIEGRIDVSFNLITRGDVQQIPLVDMSVEDMLQATITGLTSNFITARAAARRMIAQGGGVVLHLNSSSGGGAAPGMGSTGPADAAVESFMRYLAVETGAQGVRVVGIWTAGVVESLTDEKLRAVAGEHAPTAEQAAAGIAGMSVLRRAPHLADVADTAAFLASDRAAGLTGTMVNVTSGLVLR
jgi:NAD(P)-dependent dehydrogenase (short-subunit alcohol dehydrogenase family)